MCVWDMMMCVIARQGQARVAGQRSAGERFPSCENRESAFTPKNAASERGLLCPHTSPSPHTQHAMRSTHTALLAATLALLASCATAELKCDHAKQKVNGAAVRYLGATPDVKSKVCGRVGVSCTCGSVMHFACWVWSGVEGACAKRDRASKLANADDSPPVFFDPPRRRTAPPCVTNAKSGKCDG